MKAVCFKEWAKDPNLNKHFSYPIPFNGAWKEKAERAAVNNVLSRQARTQAWAASGTGTDSQVVPTLSNGLPRTTTDEETYLLFYKPMTGGSTTETPQEAVELQAWLLKSVYGGERKDSWRNNVVVGRDANNFCTKAGIAEIQQRSTFLFLHTNLSCQGYSRVCRPPCNNPAISIDS